jgi:16S rRNA (cytosine967-C5)-methyltransferase
MVKPSQRKSARSKPPRLVAALAVDAVVRRGRTLDAVLEEMTGNARDGALVREMTYGALRWYFRLAAVAVRLLTKPLKERDADVFALVIVGLYQLEYMRVPPHAAVAETVAAAAVLGKTWAKGLINAVLRRYQRERETLLADLASNIEAATAHPRWLADMLRGAWPDQWQAILEANNSHPPMVLRVNRARLGREAYLAKLQAAGIAAQTTTCAPDGLVLEKPVSVEALPGFVDGLVSVQDGAAQLAAGLLETRPGQRVLDACAAPGGKTCHILERTPALGELVAVDVDARRLAKVEENLERLQLTASLVAGDAGAPDEWWDGQPFDRILLDAPCTGTGVIRRHPDIKLLRRAEDIAELAKRQARLLDALWPLLAPGGKLVYVTCSVMPEENEGRITHFLATHDDAAEVPADMPCGMARTAGRQILTGEAGMDGFYYACIHKNN